jgi:predicted outer membrane repeat protein
MNNIATNGDGGAISSQDDVSLVSTTVYSNSAFYSGGALDVLTGTLTLSNTAIVGNVAGNWAGAIKISNGGLAIQRSLIKDNQADYAGGLSIGNTTGFIRESAIVHNFANDGEGGGLYSSTQNDLELINVTLSANYAENNGGGVYVVGPSELNLANVTIAANTILLANAAGLSLSGGSPTVRMKNSLLANNIDINSSTQVDCWGAIDSYGYNRIEALGANCTLSAFTGDATNVETYIAPLADNGGYQTPLGPLPTHALTSVGIDEGNILFCSDFSANPLQTDQRGFHRPVDSNLDGNTKCDIGAYEKQIEVFLPLIVK